MGQTLLFGVIVGAVAFLSVSDFVVYTNWSRTKQSQLGTCSCWVGRWGRCGGGAVVCGRGRRSVGYYYMMFLCRLLLRICGSGIWTRQGVIPFVMFMTCWHPSSMHQCTQIWN